MAAPRAVASSSVSARCRATARSSAARSAEPSGADRNTGGRWALYWNCTGASSRTIPCASKPAGGMFLRVAACLTERTAPSRADSRFGVRAMWCLGVCGSYWGILADAAERPLPVGLVLPRLSTNTGHQERQLPGQCYQIGEVEAGRGLPPERSADSTYLDLLALVQFQQGSVEKIERRCSLVGKHGAKRVHRDWRLRSQGVNLRRNGLDQLPVDQGTLVRTEAEADTPPARPNRAS